LFVVMSACGDDEPAPVEAGIGPEGGIIRFEDLELVVPQGALAQKTTITVGRAAAARASAQRDLIAAFELGPDGLQFAMPATARVAYSGSGREPALFTSDDGRTWTPLPDSTHDRANAVVRGSVEHFSFIALQTLTMPAPGAEGGRGGASSDDPDHGGTAGQSVGAGGAPPATGEGGTAGDETPGASGQAGSWDGGANGADEGNQGGSSQLPGGAGGTTNPGEGGRSELAGGAGGGTNESDGGTSADVGGAGGLSSDGEGGSGSETPVCSPEGGGDECIGSALSCYPGYGTAVEQAWDCSDGHRYERNCEGSGSSCECDCLIDGVAVGTCSYSMQACDSDWDAGCDCEFPAFVEADL
jgi:hypothetical protein